MSAPRRLALALTLLAVSLAPACRDGAPPLALHRLQGEALGTTWSVAAVTAPDGDPEALSTLTADVLGRVDRAFSTWRDDAELARFNADTSGRPFALSAEARHLVARSLVLARETGGAFDPTVRPLVALWGFGAGAATREPTPAELAATRARVGFDKLGWRADGALTRAAPGVQLDLSAIAKGWAVDAIVAALASAGVRGAMVEVGGEVRVYGTKPDGAPWRLGVELPTDGPRRGPLQEVVRLTEGALATSGDYRQARVEAGQRVSHIIDPASSRPAVARVASASVIAPTCAEADAVATALMVMAPERGLAFVEARPWLEALLLLREGDALGERRETSGWARYR